ncbi:MAG TPA: tetratricopeptide repeat protein [Sphingobium sp.]|nr:tetratricopeptide repeat protein [Sphingobium sp.]
MNDFDRPGFFRAVRFEPCADQLMPGSSGRPMRRAIWLLLPLLFTLSACKSPAERAADLAAQADAQAAAGNLVAARKAISEAISLRDDIPAYQQLLGAIAMKAGDVGGAYRAFSRALDVDPTNMTALAYVANLGIQLGQIGRAEEAADRLLTLDPNALPGLQAKGMIAIARDKNAEAARIGDRMLALRPGDETGTIIKARALAKQGQFDEALQLIDATTPRAGQSAALLTNKLNIYRNLRQPEAMEGLLDQLARDSDAPASVRLDQVNLFYRLGKVDAAREAAMALLRDGRADPADYRALQRLWWEFDKTPVPATSIAAVAGWQDPVAVQQTVRYLIARDDIATADAIRRAAPASAQPLLASLAARLLAAGGRDADARKAADALLKKDEQDVDALLVRAVTALDQGKLAVAVEAAQLARANDPANAETYLVLARIAQADNADWRVRNAYEEGLKNLPQNFLLLEHYTQFLHQSGDKGRAVSVARAFARATPASVHAWTILAAQCRWANDDGCLQAALAGQKNAETTYLVDDPPGTMRNRGLFGRI